MAVARCPECGSTDLQVLVTGWADYDGETGDHDEPEETEIQDDDPDATCKSCDWVGFLHECEAVADDFEEDADGNLVKKEVKKDNPDQGNLFEEKEAE